MKHSKDSSKRVAADLKAAPEDLRPQADAGGAPARLTRRRFAGQAALAAAVASWGAPAIFAQSPSEKEAADAFLERIGKDSRLIVHNTRPGVIETPLELLRKERLTPKELLFIRNNQVLSGGLRLEPWSGSEWELEITGLVDPPRTVTLEKVLQQPQTEVEAVLQCSGNGRSFYAQSAKTRGTQWGHGGMGNVRWKGAPLKDVLDALGVKVSGDAKFVAAEGKDSPPVERAPDFEHSLPVEDVLEKGLLATGMNGEPIPLLHGGPLRLIVPGYYGTMCVKWLGRLRFEAEESENYHHARRYRTLVKPVEPGTSVQVNPETAVPTWRQRIKSVIWNPLEGGELTAGPAEIRGVAWNDGGAAIASVEVSADEGKTWLRAELDPEESPYAWRHWRAKVELSAGRHEIWSRAMDEFGNGQPLDGAVHWNPSGYEWYGVDRVAVTVA